MNDLDIGSFSDNRPLLRWPRPVRIVSWNVNRGLRLADVLQFLVASSADLVLLQETDVNARRTQYVNVPRTIAEVLKMNYVFGREFEELAQSTGSSPALHGQATLSRFPLTNSRILRFRSQSGFWRPRWFIPNLQPFQRRRGARMALVSDIRIQNRTMVLYNAHLESRGNHELRYSQFSEILSDVKNQVGNGHVIAGGDMNFNVSEYPATAMIARAGLQCPFAHLKGKKTVQVRRAADSGAIDWIFTDQSLATAAPQIHDCARGSDHYPLSLEIYP
ncbi:MAG: endonuclease/exonuclease/phosphatase family protein [Terracidiphilus sp.]